MNQNKKASKRNAPVTKSLFPAITIAVLTISDRCSRHEREDTSGPALQEVSKDKLDGNIVATNCIPDEPKLISKQIYDWAHKSPKPDLLLTTGGTGPAPRDVTPEATLEVIERRCDGLMELARLRCYEKTPMAFVSRGVAGIAAGSLIINMPGSQRGAVENFEALLDILPHTIQTLRGDVTDG